MQINNYKFGRYDQFNWAISEPQIIASGKKEGETIWKVLGYYGSLKLLLPDLLDYVVSAQDVDSIEELIEVVKRSTNRIIDMVKEME